MTSQTADTHAPQFGVGPIHGSRTLNIAELYEGQHALQVDTTPDVSLMQECLRKRNKQQFPSTTSMSEQLYAAFTPAYVQSTEHLITATPQNKRTPRSSTPDSKQGNENNNPNYSEFKQYLESMQSTPKKYTVPDSNHSILGPFHAHYAYQEQQKQVEQQERETGKPKGKGMNLKQKQTAERMQVVQSAQELRNLL